MPSGLAVFIPVRSSKGKGLGVRHKQSDFSTVIQFVQLKVKDSDVSVVLN
jgi:hypothetical protein